MLKLENFEDVVRDIVAHHYPGKRETVPIDRNYKGFS